MLMLLDRSRPVRGLYFPLAKTEFELNLSTIRTWCYSVIQACLNYCVVRARFDTSHKREDTSCIVILFRDLFHLVNMIFTKP